MCIVLPCTRVRVENLIVAQLAKQFRAFYWTRNFITAFTGLH